MASTLERRVSLSQPAHSQQLTHSRGRSAPIQVHEADVYSLLQESDACAQQAAPPAERARGQKAARRLREVFASEWNSWIRGSGEKDADAVPKASVAAFFATRFTQIHDATALEIRILRLPRLPE